MRALSLAFSCAKVRGSIDRFFELDLNVDPMSCMMSTRSPFLGSRLGIRTTRCASDIRWFSCERSRCVSQRM